MAKCTLKDVESVVLELTASEANLIALLIANTGDSSDTGNDDFGTQNRISKVLRENGINYWDNEYWTTSGESNHIQVKTKRGLDQ